MTWERRGLFGRPPGTRQMNDRPPCWCCASLRQHIQRHYDPQGAIEAVDDPALLLADWQRQPPGGCDLTETEVARYLALLPTPA